MMSTKPDSPDSLLDRQRNPEPPAQPVPPAPSLWLYVVMSLAAILLLTTALTKGGENWPSFSLNLASDIIGAIVILIIVEHRLRQDELQAFRRFPLKTKLSIMITLFPDVRHALGYVRVLMVQMEEITKPYLESRQNLEDAIAEKLPNGVILIGGTGTGKTTLIHRIVRKWVVEVMREPRKAPIPILVAGRRWTDGSAEGVLLETMRSFYPVPAGIFRRLLRRGRLLCIFDSIDEALLPLERLQAIARFQQEYPGNAVVLSTRPLSDAMLSSLSSLKLERFEIPPLNAGERARLQELRARQSQV
jgi:hypothetical protein